MPEVSCRLQVAVVVGQVRKEASLGRIIFDYVSHFIIDLTSHSCYSSPILAREGRLLETILKAEHGMAFRGRGS